MGALRAELIEPRRTFVAVARCLRVSDPIFQLIEARRDFERCTFLRCPLTSEDTVLEKSQLRIQDQDRFEYRKEVM
jgi:hypothetical protein